VLNGEVACRTEAQNVGGVGSAEGGGRPGEGGRGRGGRRRDEVWEEGDGLRRLVRMLARRKCEVGRSVECGKGRRRRGERESEAEGAGLSAAAGAGKAVVELPRQRVERTDSSGGE